MTALGVAGIGEHGKRVRFYSTVDLVNALELEKATGKAGRLAYSLSHIDLFSTNSAIWINDDETNTGGKNQDQSATLIPSRTDDGRLSPLVKFQRVRTTGSLCGIRTGRILAISSPRSRVTSKKNLSPMMAVFNDMGEVPASTRCNW